MNILNNRKSMCVSFVRMLNQLSSIAIIFFSTMQRLGKITLRALHYFIFFSSKLEFKTTCLI